ncbi:unnamed protein product [Zymoseptoria tritici ST99CH_1A5]|uniref:Ubiquitin-like domain-containing protein n=3 Tax=Zymoseptoria tritici TaxID=1047171 RepID=A0A1X7RN82_ZYMT9|nr:unnamed protein product [Zymoseptoria tritici ST99CH_3D7]SMR48507.1 unnamed protein product [Zymoseptoria tritici ST99CH_1E4]SMY22387.1 unnamed protein product [Zymoseptoria tritici ST99CH_1A5]
MEYQLPTVNDADANGNDLPPPPTTAAAANDAEGPAAPMYHVVTLREQNGAELQFKMKTHMKFSKVISAFCDRTGRQPTGIRLLFDGERLTGDSTPGGLEMGDEELVEVHEEQIGGGA